MTRKFAPLAGFLASGMLFAQGGMLFAQGSVVKSLPVPPSGSRYGSILYPGGIAPPAPRLGSLVPNRGQYAGGYVSPPSRSNGRPGRDHTIIVPYAYPVYFGGDYGYNNGYAQNPAPQPITIVVPQQQQTVPTVIINQSFGVDAPEQDTPEEAANQSGVRVYKTPVHRQPAPAEPPPSAPPPGAPARDRSGDDRATIYLIALKDNSIHSAIGYWVEDSTLHYVTQQGSVNRVTLDQVDRPLSEQLNAERKVDFQIRTR